MIASVFHFTDKTVKFGTSVEITVSKSIHNFNIVFFDYQLNLCDLWTDLMHGNSQCPIKPGHYNLLFRSDALPVLITEVRNIFSDKYYYIRNNLGNSACQNCHSKHMFNLIQ